MASEPTVIDLKKAFLANQIRLLSAPVDPSEEWRENAPVVDEGDLQERVVEEVLYKRKDTPLL